MADQLTTVLLLQRARATWTTLRERKGTVDIGEQVTAPIELPEGADPFGPEAAAQLKARCGHLRGSVTLALNASQVLIRVVELPSVDPDELGSMAELQVDKFAPFTTDQMCIGHEVLATEGESSRVLVAAAPREAVDRYGGVLAGAGVFPQQIDVDVLGWLWLMKEKGHLGQTGREALLIADDQGCELVVVQAGQPLVVRTLASAAPSTPEAAREVADELHYSLTTLETEWGAGPLQAVQVWHGGSVGDEFVRELSAAGVLHVQAYPLASLPPLTEGLARRRRESAGAALDLAPPEWKASLADREKRRRTATIAGSILGVWLLVLGGIFGFYKFEQSREHNIQAEVKALDQRAVEVRNLQKQVQSLQRYADRSYSALECLREMATLMPPGPELVSFNYTKFKEVNVRGEADSDAPVLEFFRQLQSSKYFPKVQPGNITTGKRGNTERAQFKAAIVLPEEKAKK